MDIKDYLLICLSEEAGEVVQAVGKAIRFGLLDKNTNSGHTNWVDLRNEVHDVIAIYEMLCDEFDRNESLDSDLIKVKKNQTLQFMEYFESIGRL